MTILMIRRPVLALQLSILALIGAQGCELGSHPIYLNDETRDAGPSITTPPWTERSQRIEVSTFSYFDGAIRFRANRTELTTDELGLLSRMTRTAGTQLCGEDGRSFGLDITDTEGSTAHYAALQGDANCTLNTPLIAFASASPFVDSLGCKSGKTLTATLEPDSRCLHGVFAGSGGTTTDLTLLPASPNESRQVRMLDCNGENQVEQLSMQLFAAGSTTPLASAVPVAQAGDDGACLELQVDFTGQSSLQLVIIAKRGEYFMQYF